MSDKADILKAIRKTTNNNNKYSDFLKKIDAAEAAKREAEREAEAAKREAEQAAKEQAAKQATEARKQPESLNNTISSIQSVAELSGPDQKQKIIEEEEAKSTAKTFKDIDVKNLTREQAALYFHVLLMLYSKLIYGVWPRSYFELQNAYMRLVRSSNSI